ncbi:MAG: hypothetical protein V2A54_08885 [Bacteroidota bacterium]
MKKLTFAILALLFTAAVFAQQKSDIGVNLQYGKDTTRTFSIWKGDIDLFRANFIQFLGKPEKNDVGLMIWKNLNIQDIGNKIQLQIQDGICTLKRTTMTYKPFTLPEEKETALKSLKKKQCRQLEVCFMDKDGNNFVKTKKMEETIVKFLEVVTKTEK